MVMYADNLREGRPPDATTLEEAAEELLNGLLCHYEPPDPMSIKTRKMKQDLGQKRKSGHRGILRASTKIFRTRKSKKRHTKSVKWVDEQNKSKTPAIYDIGKGCQEALTECGSTDDNYLARETEKLAELSQQREPKPISKRIKTPNPDDMDSRDSADRYASVGRNNNTKAGQSATAENDPISSYRKKTSEAEDTPDDGSPLFDDQGNLVVPGGNTSNQGSVNKLGPPPSPVAPKRIPRREERKPRQQTPYKPRPQESPMQCSDPTTLCGMMCDPKFLNCDIGDEDYARHSYDDYPPPPPPPPLPSRLNYYYQYDEPANSLISEDEDTDEEDDIVETPRKGFRDRFRRKSKKSSGSTTGSASEEDRSSTGQKGRGRSRSPGRRGGRSPSRSKSPGRSARQEKKFPRSPMSFITGNRSFSRSPRAKAAKEEAAGDSEANYSVHSTGSSTVSRRKTSKSRKWFGRGRKSSRGGTSQPGIASTPTNSDWDYPETRASTNLGATSGGSLAGRGRSLERQDQLSTSRSRSYDRLDTIDRSRLSDFDAQVLKPTRSRSLDRQDQRGRQRIAGYAESHIGLSRMSFDEEEMIRQTRSRSLERPDQLLPTRSRSLERPDAQLRPSRSRSLDRQDQRSLGSRNDGRPGVTFEPGYDPRLVHAASNRSMENQDPYLRGRSPSYDRHVDPRRSSYPLSQPQPRSYSNEVTSTSTRDGGSQHPVPVHPQQPPHWQQVPPPTTREAYLEHQYQIFMAQRAQSYPPQAAPVPFDAAPRRSFEYSEPRNKNQSWWGARSSNSMDQPKLAAEPPAAVYSHEPPQHTRPLQAQPMSIYSHDPQVAHAPAVVVGRDMPPTPTQREHNMQSAYLAHQQQYADAPQMQQVDARQQMPPTPAQRGVVYPHDSRALFAQYSQQQQQQEQRQQPRQEEPRRDPTPRNRLLDLVRSPLQNQQPTRPPPRQFSVAEEIHRVSWGEAPRRDFPAENSVPPTPVLAPEPSMLTDQAAMNQAAMIVEDRQGIPPTLPGKEKALPHPPPPPPPPTQVRQLQAMPQKHPLHQSKVPPRRATEMPQMPTRRAPEMPQISENKIAAANQEQQFEDFVNENKPFAAEQKKDGKGRKLLGLFGRSKRKQKQPSNNNRYQLRADEDEIMENEGSIISDAILRDRHDRFVTKF